MGAWGYTLRENDTALDAALLLSRERGGARGALAAKMLRANTEMQASLKDGPRRRPATPAELADLAYTDPVWGKANAKARLAMREKYIREGKLETGFDEAVSAFTVIALICDSLDHEAIAKICPVPNEVDCRIKPTKTLAKLALASLPAVLKNSVVRAEYGRRWNKIAPIFEGILQAHLAS